MGKVAVKVGVPVPHGTHLLLFPPVRLESFPAPVNISCYQPIPGTPLKSQAEVYQTLHFPLIGKICAVKLTRLPMQRHEMLVPSHGSGRSPGEDTAAHSGILAWTIRWTEEPDGLQTLGSQRVGHDE